MKHFDRIKVGWLRAFVALVDEGTQVAAADALGVSQSDISRNIANLDSALQTVLFHASSSELTSSGERLLPRVREILSLIDGLRPPPTETTGSKVSARDIQI